MQAPVFAGYYFGGDPYYSCSLVYRSVGICSGFYITCMRTSDNNMVPTRTEAFVFLLANEFMHAYIHRFLCRQMSVDLLLAGGIRLAI